MNSTESLSALRTRYDALIAAEGSKIRIREAARKLGVAEAALVQANCGLESTPLATPFPQTLFRELATLGEVMALTRSDACVHERTGRYENIQAKDGAEVGVVLGAEIDLRMFFGCWRFYFAVTEDGRDSIQIFDAEGVAVHKVYRTEQTDAAAWQAFIDRFRVADTAERAPLPLETIAPLEETADTANPDALRERWRTLRDVHDFYPMLREFKVSRLGALRAAGTELAQPLDAGVIEQMLRTVAANGTPIMVFAFNRGMAQIHGGPVHRIEPRGPWLNILDERFQLHLNMEAVAQCWAVNKPSRDGWITSIEVFNAAGELLVQFFGLRKPGTPELTAWRQLVLSYCPQPLAA